MSQFSSNLFPPSRSRFSHGFGAASGGRPLVPSSSSSVVLTPTVAVNPLSNEVGSLAPIPNHGYSVNEDPVTSVAPFEPIPQMNKGKQPTK